MKKFKIPDFYRSPIIAEIKKKRKDSDPRKKDFTPTVLDFGAVRFLIARHFGFCYGVENAIEIAYKTIKDNPGRKIFLLSEMIHNPAVNADLLNMGVKFIFNTEGGQLVPWHEIESADIVIVPAFGTTLEIEKKLKEIGIDSYSFNTTCPFVEKVWNRAAELGNGEYTIIIHGKHIHEETRATYSHSAVSGASLIIKDLKEAEFLSGVILDKYPGKEFYKYFDGKYTDGFSVSRDLKKIGVVNQTTMLASETEAIADHLKQTMIKKYGIGNIGKHFADTRDTLCYATNDNQSATISMLNENVDFALVVGGYNSSNTSHLVELLEQKFPTYFINSSDKIKDRNQIYHFDLKSKSEKFTQNFIPGKNKLSIAVTSGASCPDAVVDDVLNKILSFFNNTKPFQEVVSELKS